MSLRKWSLKNYKVIFYEPTNRNASSRSSLFDEISLFEISSCNFAIWKYEIFPLKSAFDISIRLERISPQPSSGFPDSSVSIK